MNALIDNLPKIYKLNSFSTIRRGFQIAMTFRNKEGHVTFPSHDFDPTNYEDIEKAVENFFDQAFGEKLIFKVSVKPRQGRF